MKREDLLGAVTECAAMVQSWRDRVAAARAELADAESTSGEAVLDNPSIVAKVSKRMQSARDEVELAERAIPAAEGRLEQARRRVLEFDALAFDRAAERLEGELAQHRARTEQLLAQLEEHECVYVPEAEWARAARDAWGFNGPTEWSAPKSDDLQRRVDVERLRAAVLRDVAAGVDPSGRVHEARGIEDTVFGVPADEVYPSAVWGPDAVVPAPAFVSTVEHTRRLLDDLDAKILDSRAEVERRTVKVDEIYAKVAASHRGSEGTAVLDSKVRPSGDAWLRGCQEDVWRQRLNISKLERWLSEGEPREREGLLARLELLTGEPPTSSEPAVEDAVGVAS